MSTSDQDPARDAARRKFDEVASLFGPIVPPAGSPVRLRAPTQPEAAPKAVEFPPSPKAAPTLAAPPHRRGPLPETLPPAAAPRPVPSELKPEPIRLEPPLAGPPRPERRAMPRTETVAGSPRKGSAEVPWPDAFSPRANYRPVRKSRVWYWLFLIPFAAVVAAAVTLVDPRSIRTFVDQTLPQYIPAEVMQFFARPAPSPAKPAAFPPVLPPPASSAISPPDPRPAYASATPQAAPAASPEQPAPVEPSPPPDAPAPAAASSAAAPTEAPVPPPQAAAPPAAVPQAAIPQAPTEPRPVSGTSEAVPPPAPAVVAAPAPPPAASARITIYYRRNQAAAEGEARRVAAKAGHAEIRPSATTARSPMIYYFNAADRDTAAALARTLGGEGGGGWLVRAGSTRREAGAIDVLLP